MMCRCWAGIAMPAFAANSSGRRASGRSARAASLAALGLTTVALASPSHAQAPNPGTGADLAVLAATPVAHAGPAVLAESLSVGPGSANAELRAGIVSPPAAPHPAGAVADHAQFAPTAYNALAPAPSVDRFDASAELTPVAFVFPFLFINWFLCLLAIHHGSKPLRAKQYQDALELKVRQDREALVEKYGADTADAILSQRVRLGISTRGLPWRAAGSYRSLGQDIFSSGEPSAVSSSA